MKIYEPSRKLRMQNHLDAAKAERDTKILAVAAILMTGIAVLTIWFLIKFGDKLS